MNIGVIFAGGSGTRMHTKDIPKQFLMVHGKPIIVHTIEQFEYHDEIDGIVVVCIKDWIPYMEEMKYRYRLDKIGKIVPGGATGQMSIYNGLCAAEEIYGAKNNIVLIHDGVRPLINRQIISDNIACVKKNGSAITCHVAKETVILVDEKEMVKDLKINNPHKTSLYLASGMPVIIWDKAALAEFVQRNCCGITIKSIGEIDEKLKVMSEEEYQTIKANAENIGKRLRSGYYTISALK